MFSISNFKTGKQIIQGVTEDKSKDKDTRNQYDNNWESRNPPDFERNQDAKGDNENFDRVSGRRSQRLGCFVFIEKKTQESLH